VRAISTPAEVLAGQCWRPPASEAQLTVLVDCANTLAAGNSTAPNRHNWICFQFFIAIVQPPQLAHEALVDIRSVLQPEAGLTGNFPSQQTGEFLKTSPAVALAVGKQGGIRILT